MLIDWVTVCAQAINFLVLVWLLRRFLFKPILKVVAGREEKIRKELEEACKNNEEAQRTRDSLLKKQEELVRRKDAFLATAQEDAQKEKELLIKKAHEECDALRQNLHEKIENEQASVFLSLRKKIEEDLYHTSKKLLEDISHASFEEAVVDVFIHKLDEVSPQEKETLLTDIQQSAHPVRVKSAFTLTATSKTALENALKKCFGEISFSFEEDPKLLCGVELVTPGHKVSWNIAQYSSLMQEALCDR